MKHLLVTGAGGFVGAHAAFYLAKQGSSVTEISRYEKELLLMPLT